MEIIEDLLIGGYRILQDTALYRFTSDAVLLARFLRAKRGEKVADFCSGSGVVGLHFFAENTGVEHVTLFEMQPRLADMSARTVALNGLEDKFTVENVRLQEIDPQYTEAFSLYRLAELLYTLHDYRLEPKKVCPVCGRTGAKPYAVLVAAVKGGKPGTELMPALVNEKPPSGGEEV